MQEHVERDNQKKGIANSAEANVSAEKGLHEGVSLPPPPLQVGASPFLPLEAPSEDQQTSAQRPIQRTGHTSGCSCPACAEISIQLKQASPQHSLLGTGPGTVLQRRDLHRGAAVPDASGQQQITGSMNPSATVSSTGTVTVRTWGGRTPSSGVLGPAQQRVRRLTLRALTRAVRGALNTKMRWLRSEQRRYATQRVSTTDIEGAGNAAASVVRTHVGSYIRNSVGGPARSRHRFRAGGNLLDAFDPTDRRTAGEPISAEAVVWWALSNSPTDAVRRRFAFNPDDTEESAWLTSTGIPAIIGSRRADFELWDQFGFAMVGRLGNRVLATTLPPAGFSSSAPRGGGLSPAQRAVRWGAFAELMHEYFHLVEHPTHARARRRSSLDSALNEGVTDILTEDTYNARVRSVRRDPSIIRQVEGATPPSGTVIPTRFLPARYQIAYPAEVRAVRAALGAVNLDGFKAAYLMGHVEYEGLLPSGRQATPVATGTGQGIDIPASVTTLAALARGSGNTKAAIRAANPRVTSWSPLPRRLNVPNWREHIVVSSPAGSTESLSQIARQHDVTVADLNAHNRHHSGWPTLTTGMKVLIPPRGFRTRP